MVQRSVPEIFFARPSLKNVSNPPVEAAQCSSISYTNLQASGHRATHTPRSPLPGPTALHGWLWYGARSELLVVPSLILLECSSLAPHPHFYLATPSSPALPLVCYCCCRFCVCVCTSLLSRCSAWWAGTIPMHGGFPPLLCFQVRFLVVYSGHGVHTPHVAPRCTGSDGYPSSFYDLSFLLLLGPLFVTKGGLTEMCLNHAAEGRIEVTPVCSNS